MERTEGGGRHVLVCVAGVLKGYWLGGGGVQGFLGEKKGGVEACPPWG